MARAMGYSLSPCGRICAFPMGVVSTSCVAHLRVTFPGRRYRIGCMPANKQVPAQLEIGEIKKGTRHSKVIDQFGEHLICNWLSRSGFEVSIVDHTGIDIIAFNRADKRRLGISVKARTRRRGSEKSTVTIFQKKDDREKTLAACNFFACKPWVAVYVEATKSGDLYLASLKEVDRIYQSQEGAAVRFWRMTPKYCAVYESNPNVHHIRIWYPSPG